jgi:AAA+ ATPase superfamily predicted ATPase
MKLSSNMFVNREKEIEKLQTAFEKENPQLIVDYGPPPVRKVNIVASGSPP